MLLIFFPTFAENSKTGEMEMLTSYTYVEDSGLLKMDFLGLRTMAIIDDAITTVNEERGLSLTVSEILEKEAPTDLNLYKFIQKGNTADLFQLALSGSVCGSCPHPSIQRASTVFNRLQSLYYWLCHLRFVCLCSHKLFWFS